ncbi:DUF92 domain-containing protein [Paenibacillus thailandensis]|uniref:DUF92 domain-containing protein n=1 Tax=Paenibacillus thailandensis TaxID=393250 RepID=A0ABW5R008_9BACL
MVGIIDIWVLRLLAGLVSSGLIAAAAYRHRSLSASGAWSAVIMGTGFVTLGEPVWFALLIVFFVTSSALSKYKRGHRVKAEAEAGYEKSGRRDAGQVWANGGAGLLLCAADAAYPHAGWLYAYIGVMAAVNADTWATELGALSRSVPRLVTTGRRVRPGTSGAVTPLGSLAALSGAALIGAAAALLAPSGGAALIGLGAVAGLAGCFADSLLGATGQAMFRCPVCGSETERAVHCGTAAERVRGFAWMNNDRVNLLSSLIAGLLGWALGSLLY